VSETAILEAASLERSAAKAAGNSAKGGRNTNAVVDGPSRMLDYRPIESRKVNALPEAERTQLMLALSDAKYADKLPECVDLMDFSMERGNIARLLYEEKFRNSNAAAIMNQLEADEQSELAKMLLIHLPADNEKEKLFSNCLRKIRLSKLDKQSEILDNELKTSCVTSEEKTAKIKEKIALTKKIESIYKSV
jgi:hypothetical protein